MNEEDVRRIVREELEAETSDINDSVYVPVDGDCEPGRIISIVQLPSMKKTL
jgi:hypothetical protein